MLWGLNSMRPLVPFRLQMEAAYRKYNEQAVLSGQSKGQFIVDICRPGHMTGCLTTFQASALPVALGWVGYNCASPPFRRVAFPLPSSCWVRPNGA